MSLSRRTARVAVARSVHHGITTDDAIEKLTEFGELHRKGVLTETEFTGRKAVLQSGPRRL